MDSSHFSLSHSLTDWFSTGSCRFWFSTGSKDFFIHHQSLNDNVDASEASLSGWSWFNEPVGISSNNAFMKLGLTEQINTTADKSDYLWYSLSTNIQGDEPFLQDGSQTVLHVESLGHALHAFVNGKLAGDGN